ncbi:amidohydrolase [Leucobacter chromiireducens]|uniref:Amidohydrolase n=1 Tax=Leucobacter chromiireducens subsp. solipictus TaxID=398235 RepID=A0ABS1SCG2_9MICO|nr:amidohydrolase [Leucobacter chromiireducens]MBL3678234.1 amidohydrolase [Leucobacter chromiireducens subsp. solipictus]
MTRTLITRATAFLRGGPVADRGILIADGVIAAIGDSARIAALPEAHGAHHIDAAGGLLHASFADAHVHTVFGGVELGRLELSESTGAADTLARIAAYAAAHPGEWILGGGWSMAHFPGGAPSREELDRVVPDRPVFLVNADHHGAWANSRAFALAGIDAATPDPDDGRFERHADGTPSGTMHEGAQELFAHVLPPTTVAECRAGLLRGQELLHGYGVTAWQEAILGEYAGYPDVTEAYLAEMATGIDADVSGALWVVRDLSNPESPVDADAIVADFERRRAAAAARGFRADTAKIMVDGVAENLTAAMTEPYVDGCDCAGGEANRGLAYFSAEDLAELVPQLNARGFHAHFHAIGDRATRIALDAVAAVPAADRAGIRNHIAHLQVVDPVELPRFAELGVTANCQALWAVLEQQMVELTLPVLGEERAGWQYPFASLERAGAALAFGSDWSVSTPDPWQAIHVAVNRRAPGEPDAEPLLPAEALSLEAALTGYTRGSHELLGTPGGAGRLEAGAVADLALTDRDPFAGPASEIWRTRNVLTLRRGRIVADRRGA